MTDPLEIVKRLDFKQNVTIRVIDEPTGKVVQEHVGHNAATNSLLTGIAHYLIGDGVLNQAGDMLSSWVPQYISLGTMGLTSQDNEDGLPIGIGYTPVAYEQTSNSFLCYDQKTTYSIRSASSVLEVYLNEVETSNYTLDYNNNTITFNPIPADGTSVRIVLNQATEEEKELNTQLRYEEYINQAPGFGADGYDAYTNNNREWFGLGYPYSDKPAKLSQDFYNAGDNYILTVDPISEDKDSVISVTIYPDGVINQDIHDTSVTRIVLSVDDYELGYNDNNQYEVFISDSVIIPSESRIAIIYLVDSKDAVNCELINIDTLRSKITYRNIIPEVQSEIPNTIDIIFSAFISTGALKEFRGDNDYIFITEAGLWSKSYWNNSGDNGLLAGYRIMPTDDEAADIGVQETFTGDGVTTSFTFTNTALAITSVTVDNVLVTEYNLDSNTNQIVFIEAPSDGANIIIVYKTTNSWKDMSKTENREAVQKNIIRIGKNQVAQIIWKLQLGGLEQLNGLRYIYPSQYPEEVWNVWTTG